MSRDLQEAFSGMTGFSVRNMQYMRQWFQIWSVAPAIEQQLVAQIPWGQHNTVVEYALKNIHKPMGSEGVDVLIAENLAKVTIDE